MKKRLTSYPIGGLRELFLITFPLLVSVLSSNLMHFVDRLFLSHYSLDAMTAASSSGTFAYIFLIGAFSIAGISEVFVGQNNGASNYSKIASPVWQMIWFSLMTAVIFWPVAFFMSESLIPKSLHHHGIPYFKIIMLCGPLSALNCAVGGFFAGIGRPHIITVAAIVGNIFNAALDYFLIFGINGIIPSMGTKGAALATVISLFVQAIILLAFFLNHHNRKLYSTHIPKFDLKVFTQCFRVGYPSALSHIVEFASWISVFRIAIDHSSTHLAVLTIGQNIYILFIFFTEGLNKAVVAVASNIIGSGEISYIKRLLRSAFTIHVTVMLIVAVPLLIFQTKFVTLFNIPIDNLELLQQSCMSLNFVWLYMVIGGVSWIISGVLISAGDTKYIMWVNSLSSWIAGFLPVYIGIHYFNVKAGMIWALYCIYIFVNLCFITNRYIKGSWKKIHIQ